MCQDNKSDILLENNRRCISVFVTKKMNTKQSADVITSNKLKISWHVSKLIIVYFNQIYAR